MEYRLSSSDGLYEFIKSISEDQAKNQVIKYIRILMSYIDIQQTCRAAHHILADKLLENAEKRQMARIIHCALIVSYSRPFIKAKLNSIAMPKLGVSLKALFSKEEKGIHDHILKLRNSSIAHSDADEWNMLPIVLEFGGKKVIAPYHHDVHAPFTYDTLKIVSRMCEKLMDACIEEREKIEIKIIDYLPIQTVDNFKFRA